MCGIRVKPIYTFPAVWTIAPIFLSVLGLTDRKLPMAQCIFIKIRGLCIGGGGRECWCSSNIAWKTITNEEWHNN